MTIEVRVPQLPESVADATLVSWHKKPGDAVVRDENLVDLETDKVVLEVPAPMAGVISEIKLQDGAKVTSGQVLAVIEEGAAAAAVPGASAPPIMAELRRHSNRGETESGCETRGRGEQGGPDKPSTGSGRDGRVSKSDVVNYLSAKEAAPAPGVPAAPKAPAMPPAQNVRGARAEQRVPMTRLRARIAERMIQAQATQALLTSFNEVDLKAVNDLRARYKDQFEKQHGVETRFHVVLHQGLRRSAARNFPSVNASVDGNDIVYHDYFDIGVAVSTDRGLIVPVLRDADLLSFADIEKSIAQFRRHVPGRHPSPWRSSRAARSPSPTAACSARCCRRPSSILRRARFSACTRFRIARWSSTVQVVVRPMMYVALTYDHRIIDGREAVQFLVDGQAGSGRSGAHGARHMSEIVSTSSSSAPVPRVIRRRSEPRRTSSKWPASTSGRTATAAMPSAAPA